MEEAVNLVFGVVVVIVMALVFAFPVMWLWNGLMPEIFGLIEITVWQALGLSMLSGFLFNNSISSSKS